VHPDVTVFVLVTGDSDYTPLVRRLREFRQVGGRSRRRAAADPGIRGDREKATLTASAVKNKMVALDSSFDEHNYGCRSFRDFLDRFPGRVRRTGRSGTDITVQLITGW
jgi:OST-HTH/LOTUS domain